MIRYLSGEEKRNTRALWMQAFPEDSLAFADYYFRDKMADNRVLVKEEDGEIISMLHRNPYCVRVKDRLWDVDYIVGVATDKDRRKQGHMRDLLCRMLADMEEEGMPFCFLMPAAERIYRPYDFTYIFDQPSWKLKDGVERRMLSMSSGKEAKELAQWVDRWIGSHWEVYCVRNGAYMERLYRELESENGKIFAMDTAEGFEGIQGFWGIGKSEQRFLYCQPALVDPEASKPAMMGRIVHLNHFLQNICLCEDCPDETLDVIIEVEDHFLPSNHGTFCWHLDKRTSYVERVQGGGSVAFKIGQMTEWLFGYRSLEEILEHSGVIPEWCAMVRTIRGVFLDEVV